jgi:multicomponent Na+:H+ antiporter subunit F
MTTFLVAVSVIVGLSVAATLFTVVARHSVFDRIIGVGVVGTKATILLVVAGALLGRMDAYVDLAITYALLNFVGTLAVAKYFVRKEARS